MGIIQHKNFAYLKGPKGDQGPRGLTGDRGARGDTGPQGLRGPQGEPADNTVVRGLISADAPVLYNSTTGKISFDDTNFASKSYVDSAIDNQMIYSSDDVEEGLINHYFTDTRARSALSGGTGVVYNPATGLIAIGQSVGTTDNVIFGNINASGDVQIDGNLIVNGTTITVNATELAIADNMIYLNDGNTITDPDLGFAGNYNDGTYHHAGFFRDASDGYWKVFDGYQPEPDASPNINTTHPSFNLAKMQATEFMGELAGNAATATRLLTPRTISGITFDGSSDITLDTTNILEGTNNYFTNARARAAISVTGNLSYDPVLGVISYTSQILNDISNVNPGDYYIQKTASQITLGQFAAQTISIDDSNGIVIGGTAGVRITGAAGSGITLGGGSTGNIAFNSSTSGISYNDLTNKPVISDASIAGEEVVFTENPTTGGMHIEDLHPVAISGNYNSLNNLPIIPTLVSQVANDAGYITGISWTSVADKPGFATVAQTGSYTDLTNKPAFLEVTELKAIVAASSDFNDFKARIASMLP